ncbi:MAG: GNAT family N-acetyltransferase [Anaerolineales bacterium]|nr:GNAT family N-acetyltransferase [Anaerolineales bacterium]
MHIETPRLLLRHQRAEDIPALVALWCDPEVTRYMGGPRQPARLREEFERVLVEGPEPYDLYPVVEKESGAVIGYCGLLDKEIEGVVEIELVYVLARAHWGRGYASEIARALVADACGRQGLVRLVSLIEPGNIASERVALKAGMHLEREVVRPGGRRVRLYAIDAPTGEEAGQGRASTPA